MEFGAEEDSEPSRILISGGQPRRAHRQHLGHLSVLLHLLLHKDLLDLVLQLGVHSHRSGEKDVEAVLRGQLRELAGGNLRLACAGCAGCGRGAGGGLPS